MPKEYRTIQEVAGPLMLVHGVEDVAYDELGEIELASGEIRRCKVLEINGSDALVQLFESSTGINLSNSKVRFLGKSMELGVSEDMLGRVFDGLGHPIDNGPEILPEARMDIIQLLKEKGIKPTAMMDVSDGLSSEVLHICHDSGLGCNIYEEKIPIDYQTFKMAEELNMNATVCALSGGEDYELLFTAPLDAYDKLITMEEISIIGHTCAKSEGYNLITKDGNSFELKAQGWVNFNPSEEK